MTKKIEIDKKIEYLIRARYPLIYIVSHEEQRVEKALMNIAASRKKNIAFWSVTNGLEYQTGKNDNELREPFKILDYIEKTDFNGLIVLRDFHPFLNDFTVVRKLKDICRKLKVSMKNVILLSPILKVPPEIEKEIAVLDYDMPGRKEIAGIIDAITQSTEGLSETTENEKEKEKIIDAALGLTALEIENVFAKSLVQTSKLDIDVILSEKEQIIRKSGVLEFYKAEEGLNDVGGLDNLKEWLKKRTNSFSEKAREFGLPQPKGILLLGVPGCGKSLTAKAISSLWQLPLLRLDVGKVFSSLVGSSEENVRKAIKTAEAIAPSILWLDEMEKGFSGVSSSGSTDSGTTARVFGTFLTWLQEKESPVFVVATSNNVTSLPPELLRKGRFDEIFFIDLPDSKEREDIFNIHIKKRRRESTSFDLEKLAECSAGYSGAEIEQVIISALYDAFDSETDITTEMILKSISETYPLSKTMSDGIQKIKEWAKSRARFASSTLMEENESMVRKIEM